MNSTTHSSLGPWLIAAPLALVLAAAVGATAAWVRTDAPDDVTFAVFAAVTFPFVLALGGILLDRTENPEHHEDSIERQWTTRASSGAFFDTITAMGFAAFATATLDTSGVPLWVFIILGLADFSARTAVLQRKEG